MSYDARSSVCRTIFVTVQRDYIVGGQSMESCLPVGQDVARLQLRNSRNHIRQITNVSTTPGCVKKQSRQSGAQSKLISTRCVALTVTFVGLFALHGRWRYWGNPPSASPSNILGRFESLRHDSSTSAAHDATGCARADDDDGQRRLLGARPPAQTHTRKLHSHLLHSRQAIHASPHKTLLCPSTPEETQDNNVRRGIRR